MLSLISTPVEVGYYSAAAKVVEVWQFIPQTYMVNVFPVLSRSYAKGDGRMKDFAQRSLRYLLLLGLPISAGLFFAARPIIDTLYTDHFEAAIPVLRLLAPTVAIYCIHSVFWRVLAARNQQGTVLRIQVVSLVLRLVGGALLILAFGAVGAAIALPATLAVHTWLLDYAIRQDGTRFHTLRDTWPFLVAAVASGLAVGVAGHWKLSLFGLIPLGVALYGLTLLALARFAFPRRDADTPLRLRDIARPDRGVVEVHH
jgi:O-antigen/teichoic acid export membrane protein